VAEFIAGTVAEIDLETRQVMRRFVVGPYPMGVAAAPRKQLLVVANSGVGSASIVDLSSGEAKAEMGDVWQPFFLAVTADEATAVIGSRVPRADCRSDEAAAEITLVDLEDLVTRCKVRLPLGSTNVHGISVSSDSELMATGRAVWLSRRTAPALPRRCISRVASS
jgi:hypothetical protein